MLDLGVVQAVGVHRKWERKGSVHSAESLCISCPMPHWGPCAASQHFSSSCGRESRVASWRGGGEGVFCLFSESIPYVFSCTDGLLYFGRTLEGINLQNILPNCAYI